MATALFASSLAALSAIRKAAQLPSTFQSQSSSADSLSWRARLRLLRICAVVFGIELCYMVELAFVSPIVLQLGVPVRAVSLVWVLSPLLGLFLMPLLGSLSDACRSPLGRRRPFILAYSAGIVAGLLLVPNAPAAFSAFHNGTALNKSRLRPPNGVVALTVFGIGLLDASCDGCQSPARAFMLDVTPRAVHSRGLASFTVISGLGGSIGAVLGGLDWQTLASSKDMFFHEQVRESRMNRGK